MNIREVTSTLDDMLPQLLEPEILPATFVDNLNLWSWDFVRHLWQSGCLNRSWLDGLDPKEDGWVGGSKKCPIESRWISDVWSPPRRLEPRLPVLHSPSEFSWDMRHSWPSQSSNRFSATGWINLGRANLPLLRDLPHLRTSPPLLLHQPHAFGNSTSLYEIVHIHGNRLKPLLSKWFHGFFASLEKKSHSC